MKTAHKIALAKLAYHVVKLGRSALGKSDRAVVARRGVRYDLDLAEGIDLAIFLQGQFEPDTAAACARHIRPGDLVLDIGANIGAHTLQLAKAAGPSGRVFAFEPTRYAYEKLQRNLALNPDIAGRVTARQCFLAAVDGAPTAGEIYSSWPLAGGEALHAKHLGQAMTTQGAETRSLDSILADAGDPPVALVKLDVDGFECDILAGASALLQKRRPVFVMELAPYVLAERGASLERLLAYFLPNGYRFYRERDEAALPYSAAELAKLIGDAASINVIAKPPA